MKLRKCNAGKDKNAGDGKYKTVDIHEKLQISLISIFSCSYFVSSTVFFNYAIKDRYEVRNREIKLFRQG